LDIWNLHQWYSKKNLKKRLNNQCWSISSLPLFSRKNLQKLVIGDNFKLEIWKKTQHQKFFDFEIFKSLELELQNWRTTNIGMPYVPLEPKKGKEGSSWHWPLGEPIPTLVVDGGRNILGGYWFTKQCKY
jgi:hypothetical protein